MGVLFMRIMRNGRVVYEDSEKWACYLWGYRDMDVIVRMGV